MMQLAMSRVAAEGCAEIVQLLEEMAKQGISPYLGSRPTILAIAPFSQCLSLCVRFRRGDETCQLPGRAYHHSLKKRFQTWNVPSWERERIPLIYWVKSVNRGGRLLFK